MIRASSADARLTHSPATPPPREGAGCDSVCEPIASATTVGSGLPEITENDTLRQGNRPKSASTAFIVGSLGGSLLLHGMAAAVVLACGLWWKDRGWILPVNSGADSIELAASYAKPPPAAEKPLLIPRPDIKPSAATPREMEPQPTAIAKAALEPTRPSTAFADHRESPRSPPAPIAKTRASVEVAEIVPTPHEELPQRKTRAMPTAYPREAKASLSDESLASAASAASSGVKEDKPPAVVRMVKPFYPPESQLAREGGIVKVFLRVDDSGRVIYAEIDKSSGFPRLDQAVMDVVYRIQFAPADGGTTGRASAFVKPFEFTPPQLRPVQR